MVGEMRTSNDSDAPTKVVRRFFEPEALADFDNAKKLG